MNTKSYEQGEKMKNRYLSLRLMTLLAAALITIVSTAIPALADNFEVSLSSSEGWPLSGVKVYAFTEAGTYTGNNTTTDSNGIAVFDTNNFTVGNYKFRVDYMNSQYWSNIVDIPLDLSVAVVIDEGDVQVTVTDGLNPITNIKVYLFTSQGAYLSKNETSDANGEVSFIVPVDMEVKFRADNLGYQFWSDPVVVTATTLVDLTIPYQDVTITVDGIFQSAATPLQGINVYLFTSSGTYMGQYLPTDVNGQVTFSLPEQAYKVRADYMYQQFWSSAFTAQDAVVEIPLADGEITVTGNGLPLSVVPVYAYTQSGSYLNLNDVSDANGQVTFQAGCRGL